MFIPFQYRTIQDACVFENLYLKALHFSITGGGVIAFLFVLLHICLMNTGYYFENVAAVIYLFGCIVLAVYYIASIAQSKLLQNAECYAYPVVILTATLFMFIDCYMFP